MKLPRWAVIVLIVLLFFNVKTSFDISSLKNEIKNLQGNVSSIHSYINNVSSNIHEMGNNLKKEASLVNEFKYEYLEHKDKRIDYILTLKPKVYNKGETLSFLLKIGKNSPQLIETETVDNVTFTAKVNMSIFDAADIDLVIEDENSKKTEKLETIYPAAEKFAAQISAHPLGGSMRYDEGSSALAMTFDFELSNNSHYSDKPSVLEDVNLHVEVNERIIDTIPMSKDINAEHHRYYVKLTDYKIPCKAGDDIIIYATAKDDMDFNYKCFLEGWTINANGNLDSSSGKFHFGQVEIY